MAGGFEHYEISAWAKPGHRCRHNLLYWTNEQWWALGPSASAHIEGHRWKNTSRISDYLTTTGYSSIENVECLDADGRVGEALMMGLRLIDGMTRERLDALLDQGARGELRRETIGMHIRSGLLSMDEQCLKLTSRGHLLADEVLVDLI